MTDIEKVRYDGVGRSSGNSGYDVWLGDRLLGTVRPYEKRYNLVRLIVDKGWTSRGVDGQKVSSTDLRRDAVSDLLHSLGLPREHAR